MLCDQIRAQSNLVMGNERIQWVAIGIHRVIMQNQRGEKGGEKSTELNGEVRLAVVRVQVRR